MKFFLRGSDRIIEGINLISYHNFFIVFITINQSGKSDLTTLKSNNTS